MGRYSYDDMPPEGFREKRRGSGKMTAAIASIGVLLTLIAVIIYLLFTPHKETIEENQAEVDVVSVDPIEPEIIESRERTAAEILAAVQVEEERAAAPIEGASGRYSKIDFAQYTVSEGDTLVGIAEKYGLSTTTLVSVNKLADVNLEQGMVLSIPQVDGTLYTVGDDDTLASIAEARNPELTAADLASLNGKPYTAVFPGEEIFIPAPGTVSESTDYMFSSPIENGEIIARFGDLVDDKPLNGIVIASEPGSAVCAAADGTVLDIFSSDYGRSVTLLHDNGYSTDYYALEYVAVKVSERVEKGDVIGAIGTSNSYFSRPAVVFSVEQNSVPLDPVNLTEF